MPPELPYQIHEVLIRRLTFVKSREFLRRQVILNPYLLVHLGAVDILSKDHRIGGRDILLRAGVPDLHLNKATMILKHIPIPGSLENYDAKKNPPL